MATSRAMSTADAAWLHMDQPTNPMVINSLFLFDEPLDHDRVLETFEKRIVDEFPRFRQRVVDPFMGRPRFQDDPDFDLEQHMHRLTIPAPGDTTALQELVSELITDPLDFTHSPWQHYLLEGHGEGCASLLRIHHCVADGIALASLTLLLTDQEPDPGIAPPARSRLRDKLPFRSLLQPVVEAPLAARDVAGAALHEGMETLADPGHLRELAARSARNTGTLAKLLATPGDARTVLKGRLQGTRRVAWTEPFPLERVSQAARREDATINDILVTALAGALREYVQRQDGGRLDDEIHVLIPFNLRPPDQPIPRELGNRFALVVLALPTDSADPRARLRAVKERMNEIKASDEGPINFGMLSGMGLIPSAVEDRVISVYTDRASAVVTNIPGPTEPAYVAGVPARAALVWAPCSGSIGMTVSIYSYAGEVTVGLMTDIGLVPDPQPIVNAFDAELRTLTRETSSSSQPARQNRG